MPVERNLEATKPNMLVEEFGCLLFPAGSGCSSIP